MSVSLLAVTKTYKISVIFGNFISQLQSFQVKFALAFEKKRGEEGGWIAELTFSLPTST